ncbi:metal-dependent transcriptional regulator [Propionicicella superfundia]|uniref:metal-dependent transcriptional regulator n=1 Tax=Propionicicella superfundia TaxID=348582 RepID=UPI000490E431|nr:metal-dependent transcriptional regulator [Propionicicella superfundia]
MPHRAITRVVEDYVTLIWKAYEWPGPEPTTTDLAARLGVTASTVSANLKKLAQGGFIDYEPYGRIGLTEAGRVVAVEIVRRHRIIETYLHEQLGLSWDQVHDEADQLEHAVSELVLARMDEVLGHPEKDPHGDPIPDVHGNVPASRSELLTEAMPGADVQVVRVSDRSPDILRYLEGHGIVVGTHLQVVSRHDAASAIHVDVGGAPVELSLHSAAAVLVSPAG